MKTFNVLKSPLDGKNLVEASAGTGKTYSIALLVLRCILEKNIPIGQLLMVTFTKAAVAELEERIRIFVNKAYQFAQNHQRAEKDPITNIVQQAMDKDEELCLKLLARAKSELDELQVSTIHGFCESSLKEFAFSSGQLFQQDVIADQAAIVNRFAAEYWLNCAQDPILHEIITQNPKCNYPLFIKSIKNELSGSTLKMSDWQPNSYSAMMRALQERLDNMSPEDIHGNITNLKNAFDKNNLSQAENLVTWYLGCIKVNGAGFIHKPEYASQLPEVLIDAILAIGRWKIYSPLYLFAQGAKYIKRQMHVYKTQRALLSFDDLIDHMHAAVKHPEKGDDFCKNVASKFQAIFIDEFQDTDNKQYNIFNKIFDYPDKIIYFIGDPKQSIYAFRNADLDVYDAAKAAVHPEKCFTMDTNYRSTKKYVQALNTLYEALGTEDFNRVGLQYLPVNAATDNSFTQPNVEATINLYPSEKQPIAAMAKQIKALLQSTAYSIDGRAVKASDIGALFKNNKEANQLKTLLEKEGIPAIVLDSSSVFESHEAKIVYRLLQAIQQVNAQNIGSAMVGQHFGISLEQWLERDKSSDLEFFRSLQRPFQKRGVLATLNSIYDRYNLYTHLDGIGEGKRAQGNLLHLTELLHMAEKRGRRSILELMEYVQVERQNDTKLNDEDPKEKRLESDEEAVQISTIHKAKGLEYPILLAYLKFNGEIDARYSFFEGKENGQKHSYRNLTQSEVATLGEQQRTEFLAIKNQANVQQDQENRRLIYVLLTRAVHVAYLFSNEKRGKYSEKDLMEKLKTHKSSLFAINPEPKLSLQPQNLLADTNLQGRFSDPSGIASPEQKYRVHSYSSLSQHHAAYSTVAIDNQKPTAKAYDNWVYNTLPKGASVGNFLHELMESIPFDQPDAWPRILEKKGQRYGKPYNNEAFRDELYHLLEHVCTAQLQDGLALRDISSQQRLTEMEFYIKTEDLALMKSDAIRAHFGEALKIIQSSIPAGFMRGFIDLIFEHHGRYYILDWKSNHLGYTLHDYGPQQVAKAMNDNNYHLQYLIYAIALYRFLKQRLGTAFNYQQHMGGVFYVFMRALRSGQNTGVFFTPLPEALLQPFDLKPQATNT